MFMIIHGLPILFSILFSTCVTCATIRHINTDSFLNRNDTVQGYFNTTDLPFHHNATSQGQSNSTRTNTTYHCCTAEFYQLGSQITHHACQTLLIQPDERGTPRQLEDSEHETPDSGLKANSAFALKAVENSYPMLTGAADTIATWPLPEVVTQTINNQEQELRLTAISESLNDRGPQTPNNEQPRNEQHGISGPPFQLAPTADVSMSQRQHTSIATDSEPAVISKPRLHGMRTSVTVPPRTWTSLPAHELSWEVDALRGTSNTKTATPMYPPDHVQKYWNTSSRGLQMTPLLVDSESGGQTRPHGIVRTRSISSEKMSGISEPSTTIIEALIRNLPGTAGQCDLALQRSVRPSAGSSSQWRTSQLSSDTLARRSDVSYGRRVSTASAETKNFKSLDTIEVRRSALAATGGLGQGKSSYIPSATDAKTAFYNVLRGTTSSTTENIKVAANHASLALKILPTVLSQPTMASGDDVSGFAIPPITSELPRMHFDIDAINIDHSELQATSTASRSAMSPDRTMRSGTGTVSSRTMQSNGSIADVSVRTFSEQSYGTSRASLHRFSANPLQSKGSLQTFENVPAQDSPGFASTVIGPTTSYRLNSSSSLSARPVHTKVSRLPSLDDVDLASTGFADSSDSSGSSWVVAYDDTDDNTGIGTKSTCLDTALSDLLQNGREPAKQQHKSLSRPSDAIAGQSQDPRAVTRAGCIPSLYISGTLDSKALPSPYKTAFLSVSQPSKSNVSESVGSSVDSMAIDDREQALRFVSLTRSVRSLSFSENLSNGAVSFAAKAVSEFTYEVLPASTVAFVTSMSVKTPVPVPGIDIVNDFFPTGLVSTRADTNETPAASTSAVNARKKSIGKPRLRPPSSKTLTNLVANSTRPSRLVDSRNKLFGKNNKSASLVTTTISTASETRRATSTASSSCIPTAPASPTLAVNLAGRINDKIEHILSETSVDQLHTIADVKNLPNGAIMPYKRRKQYLFHIKPSLDGIYSHNGLRQFGYDAALLIDGAPIELVDTGCSNLRTTGFYVNTTSRTIKAPDGLDFYFSGTRQLGLVSFGSRPKDLFQGSRTQEGRSRSHVISFWTERDVLLRTTLAKGHQLKSNKSISQP